MKKEKSSAKVRKQLREYHFAAQNNIGPMTIKAESLQKAQEEYLKINK